MDKHEEEISKDIIMEKMVGLKLENDKPNRTKKIPINNQSRVLTPNQEATISVIRRYEDKIKLRIGEKGSFSKKYGKILKKPEITVTKKDRSEQKRKQIVEELKNLKVSLQIPFHLPEDFIKRIKEGEIKDVSLHREKEGQEIKVLYKTHDDETREIATSTEIDFSGHIPFERKNNMSECPDIGFNILETENGPKLYMFIISTPSTLRSEASKNQGDALYLRNRLKELHEWKGKEG